MSKNKKTQTIELRPLNNKIIFTFTQDTTGNMFREQTKFGIAIIENKDKQLKSARWGKVMQVGKTVSEEIAIGQYILIEPLMWTTHLEHDGVKFWVTSEEKVLAVADEAPAEY